MCTGSHHVGCAVARSVNLTYVHAVLCLRALYLLFFFDLFCGTYRVVGFVCVLVFVCGATWSVDHVQLGEGTLYSGRDGHEWIHCGNQQDLDPEAHSSDGESVVSARDSRADSWMCCSSLWLTRVDLALHVWYEWGISYDKL